ncbi:hypothetical protein NDU88_002176 [Pleurodeles waltl]|uniref:Uncharacterized protein n=1 Tax=Pleurodeles waltl TaxID=8319 RepID=A0AAV7RD86_PLEWA|nr:hypothetical protein NDU88_002176 [Pleurodeles waltl]
MWCTGLRSKGLEGPVEVKALPCGVGLPRHFLQATAGESRCDYWTREAAAVEAVCMQRPGARPSGEKSCGNRTWGGRAAGIGARSGHVAQAV